MNTTIVRTQQRNDPFARVPKDVLAMPQLSWKAKGVLAYLLGKPKDWKIRVTDLERRSRDGVAAVRSALKEIRAYGFGHQESIRDNGRIVGWVFKLADSPVYYDEEANKKLRIRLNLPDIDFLHVGNQQVENQQIENRHHTKNDCLQRSDFYGDGTGGSGGGAPAPLTKGQKKKTKKKTTSSSSFVSVETRGSAPDPATLTRGHSQDQNMDLDEEADLPGVGENMPSAMVDPETGEVRRLLRSDSLETKADYFLHTWRKIYRKFHNKNPMLTEQDQQKVQRWLKQADPANLVPIFSLAICCWRAGTKRCDNGYVERKMAVEKSRTISSFLDNMDRIEGEMKWDHQDMAFHREIFNEVVNDE